MVCKVYDNCNWACTTEYEGLAQQTRDETTIKSSLGV